MHNAAVRTSATNAARVSAGTSEFSSPLVTFFPYRLLFLFILSFLLHQRLFGSTTDSPAVVVFGDPKRGQSFGSIATSKIRTICHTGDNICEGGTSITAAHLNYQIDAGTAAAFVAERV